MPFDPKVHVGVAGIVIDARNRLLTIKRKGAHGEGTWSVPGGWVDYTDAHPEAAIRRELREEVGIDTHQNPKLVDVVSTRWDTPVDVAVTIAYSFPQLYVWGTEFASIVDTDKISDLRWMGSREISVANLFPPLKSLLERNEIFRR